MKRWLCCLLILMSPWCSGCWDANELTSLNIVLGVAVDETKKPEQVQLTFQMLVPSLMAGKESASGGELEKPPVRVGTSTAPTMFQAVRSFVTTASRRLFWGHNQVLIIHQALAEKGITPYLDFFIRDPEPRPDVPILISPESAGNILRVQSGIETIPAMGLHQALDASSKNGYIPRVTLQDFMEAMHTKSGVSVAPMVSLFEERGFNNKMVHRTRLGGTAVFVHGRMVGELKLRETSGLLWVLNQRQTGISSFSVKQHFISLEILNAHSQITTGVKNGKLRARILTITESNVGEFQGYTEITPELLADLEKRQAETVRQDILAVIQASQGMKADVLGIGNNIYAHHHQLWYQLEKEWPEYYSQLPIEVDVVCKISGTGYTNHGH